MSRISRSLAGGVLGAATLAVLGSLLTAAPAAAKTYKCWNPAICKAVCGKAVCGKTNKSPRADNSPAAQHQIASYGGGTSVLR